MGGPVASLPAEFMRPTLVLARYSLLEAARSGLPWMLLASLAGCLGLALFISEIAITEVAAVRTGISAGFMRVTCVLLLATHAITATVRDYDDRVVELSLAFPLSRGTYYLGRLLGFVVLGGVLALAMGLPLLTVAPPARVAAWTVSLALECGLVASAALFFSLSLARTVPALGATVGFYVLARAMPAIRSMAESPLSGDGAAIAFSRHVVDAVALVLPRLGSVGTSEWLLYGPPHANELAQSLAGLLLYAGLLGAAGMFDFYRRNL